MIPAECWDWPGFKNCHEEAGHKTYRFCSDLHESGSGAFRDCYSKVLEEHVELGCVRVLGCGAATLSASGATSAAMPNLPWGLYSSHTKLVQQDANRVLPSLGKAKIGEDGKLGPATCSAIKEIIQAGKIRGWSVPRACSQPSSDAVTPGPTEEVFLQDDPYEDDYSDPSSGRKLAIVVGSALLVGGAYYLWKSGKFR